jgi:flagellar FliJ protein
MTPPARFEFRLQSVLDMRQAQEQSAATRLAAAMRTADDARHAEEALANVRAACADDLTRAQTGAADVGTLRNLAYVLEQLDAQLSTAGSETVDAQKLVDQVRTELSDAARERATISRLRDRHQEVWQSEVRQFDRRTMDDIAIDRYARGREGSRIVASEPRR